ncbi:MAG TPA: hypothetical protein VHC39_08780 [Rhizomicrobium sp.]|nr:hypothetical protein [Rhizomicrobium sp.]
MRAPPNLHLTPIEPSEELELQAGAVEAPPPPQILASWQAPTALDVLSVFRHRNYRLFFIGQIVSLTGNWITNVAQGWLVYALTRSPLMLGAVTFAGQAPPTNLIVEKERLG